MPGGVVKVVPVAWEDPAKKSPSAFAGLDEAGTKVGYAVKGSDPDCYGGTVELMVGFEADAKTVVCYKVLAAAETPGLGMKLSTPEFSGQFGGKDGTALSVKKDGGDIEAITAAVCRAIAAAAKKASETAK